MYFISTWVSKPPWTNGNTQKFLDVNKANTLAPLSKRNFLMREFSMGRWPTVIPEVISVILIAKSCRDCILCKHTQIFVGLEAASICGNNNTQAHRVSIRTTLHTPFFSHTYKQTKTGRFVRIFLLFKDN